jgi:hypothetical protein
MWKAVAVTAIVLVAADMYFFDWKYVNTLIRLAAQIGRAFGIVWT